MMRRGVVCAAALAAGMFASSGVAQAQIVANPGTFSVTLDTFSADLGGQMRSGSQSTVLTNDATVTAAGTFSAPDDGSLGLPSQSFSFDGDNVSAAFVATAPATGTIDPMTGLATFGIDGYLHITDSDGLLGSSCQIGTSSAPIDFAFTTGKTAPPAPAMPLTGTSYDASTGGFGFVSNTFALPAAQNCNGYESIIDSELGLPSKAGADSLAATGTFSPAVQPAIRAMLTATRTSGTAPVTVGFDAAGSTAVAGIASYAFDPTGGPAFGTAGSSTSDTYTYTKPGVYHAYVVVTDTQGDVGDATTVVDVAAPTVAKPSVSLPAARTCLARRFVVSLHEPKGVKLASVVVTINGRTVLRRARPGRSVSVTLPRGRKSLVVRVLARTTTGRTVSVTRRYRRC